MKKSRDGVKVNINGTSADEINNLKVNDLLIGQVKEKGIEDEPPANSSPKTSGLPSESALVSPPTSKGYGLKKWKRLRRDSAKNGSASVESEKILKRELSGTSSLTKSPDKPREATEKSKGFFACPNDLIRSSGASDPFAINGSSSSSRLAIGTAFTAGTDSENSDDRSSRSSTAASAPRLPGVLGHAQNRNKIKNLSEKGLGKSIHRVQLRKGQIETSKKPRGGEGVIEEEHSLSSMESDSRSSNVVFVRGGTSVINNGKQRGRTANSDAQNCVEAGSSEQQFIEELQTGFREGNKEETEAEAEGEDADLSSEAKEEQSETSRHSVEHDPLVESIFSLQAAQEALEKEIQKLGEIGKEPGFLQSGKKVEDVGLCTLFTGTTSSREIHDDASTTGQPVSEENRQSSASNSLETQVMILTKHVNQLQSKLEEASTVVEAKEAIITKLEAALSSGSKSELQQQRSGEMEAELEGLFKQKVEAEVEYLIMTRYIQKVRIAAASNDPCTLLVEQEHLVREQEEVLNMLGETESKAAMLKRQAEELEYYCGNISAAEEVLKMQKRICKFTFCFSIQLVLLFLVFAFFILQLSSHSTEFVPT